MSNNKQSKKVIQIILLSFLFISFTQIKLFSQIHTSNLQIFYKLADSASLNLYKAIPSSQKIVKLNLTLGNSYNIFGNVIISALTKNGKNIISKIGKDSSSITINFTIDIAKVSYGDLFRESLFGEFYTTRNLTLSGNYIVFSSAVKTYNFNFSYNDTVSTSDIKNIENSSYPFTQAQLPTEPFISSIYEPVIAVGATALTVILFFTIRSK